MTLPNSGQLQWGHGVSAVEVGKPEAIVDAVWQSFNGATAFQPWKSEADYQGHATFLALQWGHGVSAVEVMRHAAGNHGSIFSCFNGATAFQPWKSGICRTVPEL